MALFTRTKQKYSQEFNNVSESFSKSMIHNTQSLRLNLSFNIGVKRKLEFGLKPGSKLQGTPIQEYVSHFLLGLTQ